MERMLQELEELVALPGAPGFEENIATVEGTGGPRLVVSAHVDEIGFMASHIETNGFLRFETMGGFDPRVLPAQRVLVRGNAGPVMGVIGCKSAHLSNREERGRVTPIDELYIGVGADDEEGVLAAGIRVGTPVTFKSELTCLGAGTSERLVGKGFDDRLGCVMLLRLLRGLQDVNHACTVYGIFSVQEELGLRGAKVASYPLEADVGLAVDATACGDTPDGGGKALRVGAGAGIKLMDNRIVVHSAVRDRLIEVAEENSIPYQTEILKGIGTDAGALHLQKGGLATGVISVPNRYTHSPIELVDVNDLEDSYRLLKAFALSLEAGDTFEFGAGRF